MQEEGSNYATIFKLATAWCWLIVVQRGAGEVLKGWHIYPLQLDDLSDISYSSNPVGQPGLARLSAGADPSVLLRALAKFSIVPRRPAAAGQLHAPSAAKVGPIFYRWAVSTSAQAPENRDRTKLVRVLGGRRGIFQRTI